MTPPTPLTELLPVERKTKLRRDLRFVLYSWLFGSAWMFTVFGATMTKFAKSLGTPDWGFGVLAALPFAGALLQLPSSVLLERYGHRKAVFIIAATISRGLWILIAAIPWILPNHTQFWWPAMATTLAVTWSLVHIQIPAWMNWMADIIPRQIRGRFFGTRNLMAQPVCIIVSLIAGYILMLAENTSGDDPSIMLKVTSAMLVIAGILGIIDVLMFLPVADPGSDELKRDGKWLKRMFEPLGDSYFRRYLAFNFFFMLGLGFMGQYIWLFIFDVADLNPLKANIMLLAVPLLMRMITYRFWGKMIDRLGKKPVLIFAMSLFLVGPAGWFFVGPEHLWGGYALTIISPLVWPGIEIANFNIMLDMSGSKKRNGNGKKAKDNGNGNGNGGTSYVAINSVITAIGGVLSGLIGVVVAKSLADFQWQSSAVESLHLTYHGVLFLISIGLRMIALCFALTLHEPRATGTRDAIRYISAGVWSNVRQTALMPTRVVGRVYRYTYRINGRR